MEGLRQAHLEGEYDQESTTISRRVLSRKEEVQRRKWETGVGGGRWEVGRGKQCGRRTSEPKSLARSRRTRLAPHSQKAKPRSPVKTAVATPMPASCCSASTCALRGIEPTSTRLSARA